VFSVALVLFEHSFLGVLIGLVGCLGMSFVIVKLIGGGGCFFK